jgi:molybdenum cofactor cytidylyltransferase
MHSIGRTGLVLLAAGSSSRMGTPKQLLDFDGKPLIRHAAEVALASGCNPVVVVLGSRSPEIRTAIADLDLVIKDNPDWQQGMGTSIHAGVEMLDDQQVDGLILALADQPEITAPALKNLAATHFATGQPIVASQYADTVGVPVYFSREFFPHLLALKPDQGCKALILSNAEKTIRLACPEAEADIDTPEDYERLARGTAQ